MIELNKLSFHYKKGKPVLSDVCTKLREGHIYGLLGLNGVGKTTLLKLISGLLFPKQGEIKANGLVPMDRTFPFLSDLYFITDEVELPNWSIADLLRVYAPLYPKFDKTYFQTLLEGFLIDPGKKINDLSYGQRKKVNIAFGLATNARIILMDEPTNGLDIPSKSQFRKIVSQYVNENKIIIVSTHQVRDIHNLIDHLLILENQHLILDENIYELQKQLKVSVDPQDADKAYYTEKSIHGTVSLVPNQFGEDGAFDIEFLFNAITANKEIINALKNLSTVQHD